MSKQQFSVQCLSLISKSTKAVDATPRPAPSFVRPLGVGLIAAAIASPTVGVRLTNGSEIAMPQDSSVKATGTPASYYNLSTVPLNISVTNLKCSDTGSGISICPYFDPRVGKERILAEIVRKSTQGPDITKCAPVSSTFKLADFDKTRPYRGTDAVFLDGLGQVGSQGPSAVSKVSFDWSLDLRFFGEVGLCLPADGK